MTLSMAGINGDRATAVEAAIGHWGELTVREIVYAIRRVEPGLLSGNQPADQVRAVLNQMLADGRVTRRMNGPGKRYGLWSLASHPTPEEDR